MSATLVRKIDLSNGLTLEFYDHSRRIAVDRWQVSLVAQIEVPINDFTFGKEDTNPFNDIDEIKACLGETVYFRKKRERNFIDEKKKDATFQSLMDSFLTSSFDYLSLKDFPKWFIVKEYKKYLERKSWYPNLNTIQHP